MKTEKSVRDFLPHIYSSGVEKNSNLEQKKTSRWHSGSRKKELKYEIDISTFN